MMFWRKRKKAPQWLVVVSQIRPLNPDGPARDETTFPEQKRREEALDSKDVADELANALRREPAVQAGQVRIKVLSTNY
jgi:hypothetical protein